MESDDLLSGLQAAAEGWVFCPSGPPNFKSNDEGILE
jgi:hypothetical protein